jgi:hypothetical protein
MFPNDCKNVCKNFTKLICVSILKSLRTYRILLYVCQHIKLFNGQVIEKVTLIDQNDDQNATVIRTIRECYRGAKCHGLSRLTA